MTDHEPVPPERDEAFIKAAVELAAVHISKAIVRTISDRGGNLADVFDLLASINAAIITTMAENEPQQKEAGEAMAAGLHADTLTEMARQRAGVVIRDLAHPKRNQP